MKPRILFFAEARTLAHVARPYLLASCLDPELFEVHIASDTHYDFVLEQGSYTRWPLSSLSPAEFAKLLSRGEPLFSTELVSRYVEEELRLIEAIKPDLIVGDLRVSLGVSAPFAQVPYMSISNAYWSPYAVDPRLPVPSFRIFRTLGLHRAEGEGERLLNHYFQRVVPYLYAKQAKGLDTVRRRYGLSPFPGYLEGFTFGDITLYADTPSVAPTRGLPPNHVYIGPLCWSPRRALPDWWEEAASGRPLVYLSLGSSGEASMIPEITAAFEHMEVEVVLATAGRRIESPLPSFVRQADYLPGHQAAAQAALVVTNGGSPATYQALAQGTPVLGVASNADQLLCMRNVEQAGAGIRLRADFLDRRKIAAAAERLLGESVFRAAAGRIAQEFAAYDARRQFAGRLCALFGIEPARLRRVANV